MNNVVLVVMLLGAVLLPGIAAVPTVAQGGADHCASVDDAFVGC